MYLLFHCGKDQVASLLSPVSLVNKYQPQDLSHLSFVFVAILYFIEYATLVFLLLNLDLKK